MRYQLYVNFVLKYIQAASMHIVSRNTAPLDMQFVDKSIWKCVCGTYNG